MKPVLGQDGKKGRRKPKNLKKQTAPPIGREGSNPGQFMPFGPGNLPPKSR